MELLKSMLLKVSYLGYANFAYCPLGHTGRIRNVYFMVNQYKACMLHTWI